MEETTDRSKPEEGRVQSETTQPKQQRASQMSTSDVFSLLFAISSMLFIGFMFGRLSTRFDLPFFPVEYRIPNGATVEVTCLMSGANLLDISYVDDEERHRIYGGPDTKTIVKGSCE
ncbi:MAG: hypothetical protein NUV56_03270 [Candidatus Uhrbacteria bacterium]|nr:hypothetical protein [Candidatus Uhrbacteria bacterium]